MTQEFPDIQVRREDRLAMSSGNPRRALKESFNDAADAVASVVVPQIGRLARFTSDSARTVTSHATDVKNEAQRKVRTHVAGAVVSVGIRFSLIRSHLETIHTSIKNGLKDAIAQESSVFGSVRPAAASAVQPVIARMQAVAAYADGVYGRMNFRRSFLPSLPTFKIADILSKVRGFASTLALGCIAALRLGITQAVGAAGRLGRFVSDTTIRTHIATTELARSAIAKADWRLGACVALGAGAVMVGMQHYGVHTGIQSNGFGDALSHIANNAGQSDAGQRIVQTAAHHYLTPMADAFSIPVHHGAGHGHLAHHVLGGHHLSNGHHALNTSHQSGNNVSTALQTLPTRSDTGADWLNMAQLDRIHAGLGHAVTHTATQVHHAAVRVTQNPGLLGRIGNTLSDMGDGVVHGATWAGRQVGDSANYVGRQVGDGATWAGHQVEQIQNQNSGFTSSSTGGLY
jgi:hypothetical protein